jgi:hypothetical protein
MQTAFWRRPGVAVPGSALLNRLSNQVPGVFYYSLRLDYQSRSALDTYNATRPSCSRSMGPQRVVTLAAGGSTN